MDKVNLIYGVGDTLHTHLNINPFTEEESENIVRCDITNIDKYVDDAELTELVAMDVIDYVPIDKVDETLTNWVKKIRIGGSIIIGGTDLIEVAKSLAAYKIDITDANILIHGEQSRPYMIKRVNFTALGMCEYLEAVFNLKIIKKRVSNYQMTIEAKRAQ